MKEKDTVPFAYRNTANQWNWRDSKTGLQTEMEVPAEQEIKKARPAKNAEPVLQGLWDSYSNSYAGGLLPVK